MGAGKLVKWTDQVKLWATVFLYANIASFFLDNFLVFSWIEFYFFCFIKQKQNKKNHSSIASSCWGDCSKACTNRGSAPAQFCVWSCWDYIEPNSLRYQQREIAATGCQGCSINWEKPQPWKYFKSSKKDGKIRETGQPKKIYFIKKTLFATFCLEINAECTL